MRAPSHAASVRSCRLAPLRHPTCCGAEESVLLLSFVTDGKCFKRPLTRSVSLGPGGRIFGAVTSYRPFARDSG